jgi:hypothetical protein
VIEARARPARSCHERHARRLRGASIEGHRLQAAMRLRDAFDQAVGEVGATPDRPTPSCMM